MYKCLKICLYFLKKEKRQGSLWNHLKVKKAMADWAEITYIYAVVTLIDFHLPNSPY